MYIMENKLKINHFKELYKSLKTPFPPINFLILGVLIGLENRWINIKAEQAVDSAIDEYKMNELPEPVYLANTNRNRVDVDDIALPEVPEVQHCMCR